MTGFEPVTLRASTESSTTELHRQVSASSSTSPNLSSQTKRVSLESIPDKNREYHADHRRRNASTMYGIRTRGLLSESQAS
jgi:hypothetical protein